LPQGTKVIVKVNQLQELKLLYNSLSLNEKDQSYKKFGRIANLLEVEIQGKALVVMLNYWDPSFKVFTFDDVDTIPTVMEYTLMLNLPLTPQSTIYIPKLKGPALSKVADLLCIAEATLAEKMIKRGNKVTFINLLAFAIYALILWYFWHDGP